MGARRCALTFDDGPDPVRTPAVLESLAEHRLRATFFVIGSRADLGEAGKHAHDDPEPVGLAWRSNSRRTCSVVGGRNASSRARMASEECCFATAMRHRIAVSHDRAGRKHKSSSVGAVDQTAGAGAKRPPSLRAPGSPLGRQSPRNRSHSAPAR
jgi:peptidoglycan/xylan/chitin deacetylase (PgdA/CDA1 family)